MTEDDGVALGDLDHTDVIGHGSEGFGGQRHGQCYGGYN